MGDSATEKGGRLEKKEIQRMIRLSLTRRQRALLSLSDLAMVAMLLTDMAYFAGLLKEPNLMHLALLNLSVVVIGYISYKTKRIVSRRVARDILREGEEDAPDAADGGITKGGRSQ
jgi:hypothetical protein